MCNPNSNVQVYMSNRPTHTLTRGFGQFNYRSQVGALHKSIRNRKVLSTLVLLSKIWQPLTLKPVFFSCILHGVYDAIANLVTITLETRV